MWVKGSASQYGFIAEVLSNGNGQPFARVRAISNIAWDDATLALYHKLETGGFDITNLDSLIGAVILQREPVMTNHPASDPRSGGLPMGHPALHSYLGLPLILGKELVGIAGVANRQGGYNESVITTLEPIVATSASLIVAWRLEREREASALALRQLSQAVEQSPENIIITDRSGCIEYLGD